MTSHPPIKVLLTGFGPFLNITTNPSWEIARSLPPTLSSTNASPIHLLIPDAPIPAAYHKLLTLSTSLIETHDPDVVIHLGLAAERSYFAMEKSAAREGYHDVPDVERKVVTRAENRKLFGKVASSLGTELDVEGAVGAWRVACGRITRASGGGGHVSKGKAGGKGKAGEAQGKKVDVRASDDVGTYVCGLIYFASMVEMERRKGTRDVVFLHVPPLDGEGEVGVGVEVVKEAVIALVDVWEARG